MLDELQALLQGHAGGRAEVDVVVAAGGALARSGAQMNGIGNVVGMAPAALGGCSRIAWVGHAWKALSGISAQDFRPGTGTSDSRQRIAGFFPAWTVESFDVSPDGDRITLSLDRPRRTLSVVELIVALESKSAR